MGAPAGGGGGAGGGTLALSLPPLRGQAALIGVLVAGGGLGGASAACHLARAGQRVTVLEREAGPTHKVCGEFLSGPALADLRELGVDAATLGAAPIGAVRLVHRGRVAEGKLPFAAAGLSRLALDEALLRRAGELGVDVQRGVAVRRAGPEGFQTDAGLLRAPTMLLATGKHDLRGAARTLQATPEPLIGFKAHFRLRPEQRAELAGHVEVLLLRDGYIGLQLVEGNMANLCLLVHRSRYGEAGQDWPTLLETLQREEAHLARRLYGAVACWKRPLSIFRVPYGFVHGGGGDGLYRLGDQAAVIPSFCGDGMAIALHSARLAAGCILAGHGPDAYHAAVRRDVGPPVRLATRLYRLTRSPAIRSALLLAARAHPGLLGSVARRTRVAAGLAEPGRPPRCSHTRPL